MSKIEQYIAALEQSASNHQYGKEPEELYEPIKYLMSLGGKRLRPALVLLAYELFKDDWQTILKPALAVEVFHNFTLMHDDIMDDAPLRRGQPTVHIKWNRDVAILSGDVMLVAAYELLSEVPENQLKNVLRRFNRTAAEVCEGQQLDMNFASRPSITEAEYLNMIKLKTSVLLGFALELGGILAAQPSATTQTLYQIGVNLGLGFQLKDDILDVYGDPEKFGKQVGGDIIENKKTWLMLKALELSENKPTGILLREWLAKTTYDSDEKVNQVRGIFTELGIKQLAESVMNDYFQQGFEGINDLEVPENRKNELRNFAQYLLGRES